MGTNNEGGCGCGPKTSPRGLAQFRHIGGQAVLAEPTSPSAIVPDPLVVQPTPTGHTLPFATGGVFHLPKHITDESTGYEDTPRPAPGLGQGPNAILAEYARLEAADRAGYRPSGTGAPPVTKPGYGPSPKAAPPGIKSGFLTEVQKDHIRRRIEELKGRSPY